MKSLLLVLFFPLMLLSQPCDTDNINVRGIKAFQTDNNIQWELVNHQVFIHNDCPQNDKLLLHLVGSFDNPGSTTFFPSLAVKNGYKAIVLKYPNNVAAVSACGNSSSADCYENYRHEILFGEDKSSEVEVNEFNCIHNRLLKLLLHLEENFPQEGWASFLINSEEINWSNIVVSGHSQGGGHAAFIAKQFEVDRALMFASPNDYSDFYQEPAQWLSKPSATRASNYYAFGHQFDNVVDYNKQMEVWTALKMLENQAEINVDNNTCNYNLSQVLFTQYQEGGTSGNHSNMIIDGVTPLEEDMPVFQPVWEYMLGVCNTPSTIEEISADHTTISIYPNPTSSILNINSEFEIRAINLVSYDGILLNKYKVHDSKYSMDLSGLEGLFFLRIYPSNSTLPLCKKIVVLH